MIVGTPAIAHALRTLNPRPTIFVIQSYLPGRSSGIGGIARFSAIRHNLPNAYAKMYTVAVAFFGQSHFVATRIDKAASAASLKAFREAQRLSQRLMAELISVEFTTCQTGSEQSTSPRHPGRNTKYAKMYIQGVYKIAYASLIITVSPNGERLSKMQTFQTTKRRGHGSSKKDRQFRSARIASTKVRGR